MKNIEQVDKKFAVEQVRQMAYQFADMYYTFVAELREQFGEKRAKDITQKVLFSRARERAEEMIKIANEQGIERTPENIGIVSNVPYLGWVSALGKDHCPYGVAWKKRVEQEPWFQSFACLYCDVTDTTIAEVFTSTCSHKLFENVLLGNERCERKYYLSNDVVKGKYTYE